MFRQKATKRKRVRLSSSVHRAIRKAVEAEAKEFNVSMSFVQSVALAEIFGIDIETYYRLGDHSKGKVIRFRRRA